MIALAVVALVLAGSFASAVLVGRRLAKPERALPAHPAAAAVDDVDAMAAMDRERERVEVNAEAAGLLAELRWRGQ